MSWWSLITGVVIGCGGSRGITSHFNIGGACWGSMSDVRTVRRPWDLKMALVIVCGHVNLGQIEGNGSRRSGVVATMHEV